MEQIKSFLSELGKKTGKAALSLIRTGAETAADVMGRAAGHAVKFARDKGGELAHAAGDKVKTTAKEHRQGLLLFAACVSGAVMIASLIGYFLGRKK